MCRTSIHIPTFFQEFAEKLVSEFKVCVGAEFSEIRIWSAARTKNIFGKESEFLSGDLREALDTALALMEFHPQYARAALQFALLQARTKIQGMLAAISGFRGLVSQIQASLRR